jgi:signal transduction histidine kinase
LTLAFALVMAIVLGMTGSIVYGLFRDDLDRSIDRSLRARSDEVAALVGQNNDSLAQSLQGVSGTEDDFAQVLRADGALLASTPLVRGHMLLTGVALRQAGGRSTYVEHTPIAGLHGSLRMHAAPIDAPGGRVIVAVGTTLDERDGSLRTLAALLAGGGAVALVLASLAGYGVAAAALRPVDAMRRRAAAISPAESDRRLPVPPSGDEISRLGATLNEMLDRLQAAFARERVFAADASHELRTPLAILKAEVELALRRGQSAEELRAALESVGEEADRLVRLAEDLLVLARLDQGRLPVRRAEIDVYELWTATAGRFQARARHMGRSVTTTVEHGVRVQVDRVHLEQALGNMLDNALRYAAHEVRFEAVARDSVVELHVVDDGPGFEPQLAERAFERFARGDGARSRGGTGLGLAIVAAIAASHGGHVRAANLPDGGADVWLELPRTRTPHPLGDLGRGTLISAIVPDALPTEPADSLRPAPARRRRPARLGSSSVRLPKFSPIASNPAISARDGSAESPANTSRFGLFRLRRQWPPKR